MKKINLLIGRERHDKPKLVLSIFLSVLFFSSPLTGLFNPDKETIGNAKHYHDNPQGFYTFFVLLPYKNSRLDTAQNIVKERVIKELPKYTTSKR